VNRNELARQAWAILLGSPNLRHDFEADWIAECAVKAADELLAKLNITPETVAESQQASAGLIKPEDEIEAMRYTMSLHMLRDINSNGNKTLALIPNSSHAAGDFWDVVEMPLEGSPIPYDCDSPEHLWLIGRDKDPLNAVFQAGRRQ
jgi:hypothetical protein